MSEVLPAAQRLAYTELMIHVRQHLPKSVRLVDAETVVMRYVIEAARDGADTQRIVDGGRNVIKMTWGF